MIKSKVFRNYWREILLLALLLINLLVWARMGSDKVYDKLNVYFLNVGQGDAIFFQTPSGKQMLIDSGKNKQVVSDLGRILPFGDSSIDVVLATHPDADHIGGLPEVVGRFEVDLFIEPGVITKSFLNDTLHHKLKERGVETLLAKRGQVLDFGDGVKLSIIFPNQNVSQWETNDASIVAILKYGEHEFLLTGDAGIKTENILTNLNHGELDVEVLKAGHHGSRTSTSFNFAEAASPVYAIISAGKGNSYGHPHPEVMKILQTVGAKTLSTATQGTIHFETDGIKLQLK